MSKYIRCINKRYDEDTDIVWGTFQTGGRNGKVPFDMPINDHDFELGKDYTITFNLYNRDIKDIDK